MAEQRRDVTIIEMKPDFVMDLDPYAKPMLMHALKEQEVRLMANCAIQKFLPDGSGVTYKDLTEEDGPVHTLKGFDSIVLALGHKSREPFGEALRDIVPEVYVVGDAKKVGFVEAATHGAIEIAMQI